MTGYLAAKHVCIDGKAPRGTVPAGVRHAPIQTVSRQVVEGWLIFGSMVTIEVITGKQSIVTNLCWEWFW